MFEMRRRVYLHDKSCAYYYVTNALSCLFAQSTISFARTTLCVTSMFKMRRRARKSCAYYKCVVVFICTSLARTIMLEMRRRVYLHDKSYAY